MKTKNKVLEKFKLTIKLIDRRRFSHKRTYFHKLKNQLVQVVNIVEAPNKDKNNINSNINSNANQAKINNQNNVNKAKKVIKELKQTKLILKTPQLQVTPAKTKIINIKGKQKIYGCSLEQDPSIIYCGRIMNMAGWRLKPSIWANPFKVTKQEDNKEVCIKYEKYIRNVNLEKCERKNQVIFYCYLL